MKRPRKCFLGGRTCPDRVIGHMLGMKKVWISFPSLSTLKKKSGSWHSLRPWAPPSNFKLGGPMAKLHMAVSYDQVAFLCSFHARFCIVRTVSANGCGGCWYLNLRSKEFYRAFTQRVQAIFSENLAADEIHWPRVKKKGVVLRIARTWQIKSYCSHSNSSNNINSIYIAFSVF